MYAHGRSWMESNATRKEFNHRRVQSHSLPVISHSAPSMGQVEQIGDVDANLLVDDGYEV